MDRDLRAAAAAVEAAAGEHGWNIKDLAAAAEVDPATVTDFLAARRWPRNVTRAAIEKALGWQVGSIAQIAHGGAAPAASSSAHEGGTVSELLVEAERLNDRQRAAVLTVVRAMLDPGGVELPAGGAKTEQGGRLIDLARPPLPDLSRVAARRGESEGRRLREEQDQTDDEDPDHTDG